MRVMMRVKIPADAGNAAIADGTLSKVIGSFMARYKPEAAYFLTDGGVRTGYFFVNMAEPSDLPAMAEGFFFGMKATVEVTPAMTLEDLQKGLAEIKVG